MNFNDRLNEMRASYKFYCAEWQKIMNALPKPGNTSPAEFKRRVTNNLKTRARFEDCKPTPANWVEAAKLTYEDADRVYQDILSDIADWNE